MNLYRGVLQTLGVPCYACGIGANLMGIITLLEKNIPLAIHGRSPFQMFRNINAETFEKDIFLFSEPAEKFKQAFLYIVITSDLPVEIMSLTYKCAAGGADCIQLRSKTMDDEKLLATAEEFVQINKDEGVLSIINDRIDIAIAAGADYLVVGRPITEAADPKQAAASIIAEIASALPR